MNTYLVRHDAGRECYTVIADVTNTPKTRGLCVGSFLNKNVKYRAGQHMRFHPLADAASLYPETIGFGETFLETPLKLSIGANVPYDREVP